MSCRALAVLDSRRICLISACLTDSEDDIATGVVVWASSAKMVLGLVVGEEFGVLRLMMMSALLKN